MGALLPAVIGVPLLAAAIVPLAGPRVLVRRSLLLGVPILLLAVGIVLIIETRDGDVVVEQVAGWRSGVAIPFVADAFSALLLTVMMLLVLVCSGFIVASGEDANPYVVPMVLVLAGGVGGALLTADLFNLFVCIEVALIPTYVLISRSGRGAELSAGRIYVTVNLLASTVLLAGVALVYGVTGTLQLGELAGAGSDDGVAALAGGVVLVALAVKAGLVPVHGWLPRTYPNASPAITALFSGLLTKVGVYAVFRIYAVYFEGADRLHGVMLVIAVVTMVVGVFGALGEQRMRSILAFHMVSQTGYLILGLALFGLLGTAAAIFYLVQYVIVKASLFLSCGAVETVYGSDHVDRLGGVAHREPWLGVAFLASALSLAGLPPFSGFVAKYVLVRAALDQDQFVVAAAVVAVSLFTLLSMLKIWTAVFWGHPPEERRMAEAPGDGRVVKTRETGRHTLVPARLVLPGLALAVLTLVIGLAAEPMLTLAEHAGSGLVDPAAYVEAVTGR